MPFSSDFSVAALTVSLGLFGCSGPPQISGSRLVIPTSVGEGHNDAKKARPKTAPAGSGARPAPPAPGASSASAGTSSPPSPEPRPDAHGSLPDPAPLTTAHQLDLTVRYAKGALSLVSASPVELARPVTTPRRMGRFAVELWIGKELVDRVRFDFPLLAAEAPVSSGPKPIRGEPPRFSPGADTRCHVQVPASDRATSARLLDRLTGDSVSLPWPPETKPPAPKP